VCWAGFGFAGLGYGLFYGLYSPDVSFAAQESIQVVAGLGVGFCFSASMLVIQAAMPLKDMAASTAAWILIRSMGATVGKSSVADVSLTQGRTRHFPSAVQRLAKVQVSQD
jgi:hypothetical protein